MSDVPKSAGNPLLLATDWGGDGLAVVDLTTPEAPGVRVTAVGGNPRAVAVGSDGTRAYVVNHDDGTLSVVDLTAPDHPELAAVPAGKGPCAVVAGLVDDRVCVVAQGDGTVVVFDKEGSRRGEPLPVGTGPCTLVADPGGGAGRVCVVDESDGTVSVVDVSRTDGPSRIASVPVPGVTRAIAVAPGGRFAYVASRGDGTADGRVTVLDLDADGPTVGDPVPVEAEPRALALSPAGDRLCVANYGSASVSVATVHPDSGLVDAPAAVPAGPHPVAVAFAPDGGVIHVVGQTSGTLTAIDPNTLDHADVSVGGVPSGTVFGPDGRYAYVTDQATGKLTAVRTAPHRTGEITTGAGSKPVNVAVSPDGTWAYAADSESDKVAVLDLGQTAPLAPIPLGDPHKPWDVAIAPNKEFACATAPDTSHLLVLTPAQGTKLGAGGSVTVTPVPLATGACPHGVAVTPDSRYAVTADSGTATVSLVDPKGGTHTIDAEVVGCKEPTGVAVSKDGRTLYVSDFAPADGSGGKIAILHRTDQGQWEQQGFIDAVTGDLSGPHESALSPDELRLYVANYSSGTVSVLKRDAVGGSWSHEMPVTKSPAMHQPYGLALSPGGKTLYVSNAANSQGTVEEFDVSVNPAIHRRTITIKTNASPLHAGLALSPDGQYLYAVDTEYWRQGTGAMGTVYGIKLDGGTQMHPIATASAAAYIDRPSALVCPDDRTLCVVNQGKTAPDPREACLAVITLDDSRLGVRSSDTRPLDKNDLPYAAAVSDDGTVYVANFTAKTVTVFGSKVTPVQVGEQGASEPWDVAVTDDGVYAYVTDRTANSLRCVRLADHHVTSLDVGRDPMGVAVAPGGLRAYVANHGDDSISVIARSAGEGGNPAGAPEVVDPWQDPRITKPESVSVSADGAWLFVTTENGGALLMLDTRTGKPRFSVPDGAGLTGSAPHPDREKHLVYLADAAGAVVAIVDTTTLTPLGSGTPMGLDVRQAAQT
ncbi:beta-propeller fold lactonase family protein [Streptomyces sp. NPDC001678]|uniref:beta-propeller fold lactonase family protein n=1 Tax=Streptomyces sp. NPDC001678 TaxID=3364599 RepID=UPI0036B5BF67